MKSTLSIDLLKIFIILFYLNLLNTLCKNDIIFIKHKNAADKPFQVTLAYLLRLNFGGEKGIRTPGTVITVHMISNHAPSASSDISPNTVVYYNKSNHKNQV